MLDTTSKRKNGVTLPDKKAYRPADKEPFMNDRQREYFRDKLLAWKDDILHEAKETLQHLQDENQNHPDLCRPRIVGDRPCTGVARP